MKLAWCLCVFAAATAWAGNAPESLAGRVFHETGGIPSIRIKWELSFTLGTDGRYRFIKYARGSTLQLGQAINLEPPPADGTYTYTRTGDDTGTLTLADPTGALFTPVSGADGPHVTSWTFSLRFLSPTGGDELGNTFYVTDAAALATAPATNISMRGTLSAGGSLIVGFVIPPGAGSRDVLVRAAGPALTGFGVSAPWADPDFKLFAGTAAAAIGAHYADVPLGSGPAAALTRIFTTVGAFGFTPGAKDAVAIVRLQPGAYTAVATPAAGDAGGETLLEVYFLP